LASHVLIIEHFLRSMGLIDRHADSTERDGSVCESGRALTRSVVLVLVRCGHDANVSGTVPRDFCVLIATTQTTHWS
jgi:hypothetical protein